ncbi:MAG TPA: DinB family protein [Ktedonobacterales bacterium]|nr:DinB family protein [Ktedonobacterales bacterium]
MDARELFLLQHARLHAASTSGVADTSFQDGLYEGLSAAQMVERPHGMNSIAWLLWHITRFEDLVINTILRGADEVLDRDDWLARLRLTSRLVGTGSGDDELVAFGAAVDPAALVAYRAAVGGATRAWVASAPDAVLAAAPDVAGRLARAPLALDERAAWVAALWANKTGYALLTLPILDHGHLHLGEARVTKAHLRRDPAP